MKKLLFSAEGRIGRATFWKGIIGSMIGYAVIAAVLNFVLAKMIPNEAGPDGGFSVSGAMALPFFVLNFAAFILPIWSWVCLGVKRYHDRDKPGVWVLLALVPILNLWYIIETGFLSGTAGPNTFGPDPRGRSLAAPSSLSPAV